MADLPHLFVGYPEPGDRHDLLLGTDGNLRPGWRRVADALGPVAPADLVSRRTAIARRLAGVGAGHLLHDDAGNPNGPLRLDPLPCCVDVDSWTLLEAALDQRVRLMEALTADLFDTQQVLHDGVVPAEAVYADPSYRRAVTGLTPVGGRWLTVVDAEVAVTADGSWVVLGVDADAPTSYGDALLYRDVLRGLLAGPLQRSRPAPLLDWFARLRDALAASAPRAATNPRTVVLTTGLDHAAYLEHSYLASELGFNLVEDGDLLVRSGRVWLRSLGDLEPVDVVLRGSEDRWSDPLELDPTSVHGVAGLLAAARSGSVAVANTPGSAIAGSRIVDAWYDELCAALLHEPARLAPVATHWLGDPERRALALERLDAFDLHELGSAFGAPPCDPERAAAGLSIHPERYVAVERPALATAPVLETEGVNAVPVVVRTTVLLDRRAGVGTSVLSGGVVRRAERDSGGPSAAMDLWIVGRDRIGYPVRVTPAVGQIDLRASLPTRTAEALFWLGRNAERAETVARIAGLVLTRRDEEADDPDTGWLGDALAALRAVSSTWMARAGDDHTEPADGTEADATLPAALRTALVDSPAGLTAAIGHLLTAARTARSFLSSTSWRLLADVEDVGAALRLAVPAVEPYQLSERLDRVIVDLAALAGLNQESVVRGPGWVFLDLGRRLERAILLLNVAEALLAERRMAASEAQRLELALVSCESLIAYRRRYRSDLSLDATVDLLALDPANPRGLAFQLDRIGEHLDALPLHRRRDQHAALVGMGTEALGRLRQLVGGDGSGMAVAEALPTLVLSVRGALLDLADDLVRVWFAHADVHAMRVGSEG